MLSANAFNFDWCNILSSGMKMIVKLDASSYLDLLYQQIKAIKVVIEQLWTKNNMDLADNAVCFQVSRVPSLMDHMGLMIRVGMGNGKNRKGMADNSKVV